MSVLTREHVLSVNDLSTEIVGVPEWGGEVIVRCLTCEERDELEGVVIQDDASGVRKIDVTNFRSKLVALSMIDEKGNRLFTLDDVKALAKKSAKALDRVFNVAERLSALRQKDEEKAVKN